MKTKHPMQPIIMKGDTARFHENRIVQWMLDQLAKWNGITLNDIAVTFDRLGKDRDDYQQLMQLIGYSVSGYGDLSSSDPKVVQAADKVAAMLVKQRHARKSRS